MSFALLVQAATHRFRQLVPKTCQRWNAIHLAAAVLSGNDGDTGLKDDTIVVTCYNNPPQYELHKSYTNLPKRIGQKD